MESHKRATIWDEESFTLTSEVRRSLATRSDKSMELGFVHARILENMGRQRKKIAAPRAVALFVMVFVLCMSMNFVVSSSRPLTPRAVSDEVLDSMAVTRGSPGPSLGGAFDTRAIREMTSDAEPPSDIATPPSPDIPSPPPALASSSRMTLFSLCQWLWAFLGC